MNTNEELIIFCKNIKTIRQQLGITQREMAKICNIGIVSLRKIENGIFPQRLTVEPLIKICRVFEILPYKLFQPITHEMLENMRKQYQDSSKTKSNSVYL